MGTDHTVVLQCHPLDESYNMALLEAVTAALDGKGVEFRLHRFYPDGPPSSALFDRCRHLIVVTPTWWGAMPAVILRWIQENLGPWIDDGRTVDESPLRSVERVSVVGTHGSSKWTNMLQGEPGLRLWKRSIVPLCADGAAFDWIALYKIDRLDLAARQRFIVKVEKTIADLSATPT